MNFQKWCTCLDMPLGISYLYISKKEPIKYKYMSDRKSGRGERMGRRGKLGGKRDG